MDETFKHTTYNYKNPKRKTKGKLHNIALSNDFMTVTLKAHAEKQEKPSDMTSHQKLLHNKENKQQNEKAK